MSSAVKIAVIQHAPVFLNIKQSLKKAEKLAKEYADKIGAVWGGVEVEELNAKTEGAILWQKEQRQMFCVINIMI